MLLFLCFVSFLTFFGDPRLTWESQGPHGDHRDCIHHRNHTLGIMYVDQREHIGICGIAWGWQWQQVTQPTGDHIGIAGITKIAKGSQELWIVLYGECLGSQGPVHMVVFGGFHLSLPCAPVFPPDLYTVFPPTPGGVWGWACIKKLPERHLGHFEEVSCMGWQLGCAVCEIVQKSKLLGCRHQACQDWSSFSLFSKNICCLFLCVLEWIPQLILFCLQSAVILEKFFIIFAFLVCRVNRNNLFGVVDETDSEARESHYFIDTWWWLWQLRLVYVAPHSSRTRGRWPQQLSLWFSKFSKIKNQMLPLKTLHICFFFIFLKILKCFSGGVKGEMEK